MVTIWQVGTVVMMLRSSNPHTLLESTGGPYLLSSSEHLHRWLILLLKLMRVYADAAAFAVSRRSGLGVAPRRSDLTTFATANGAGAPAVSKSLSTGIGSKKR